MPVDFANKIERFDIYITSEDDNVFSPNFLEYMNTCLEKYKYDSDIVAVCGYSYPIDWDVSDGATVLKQQINVSVWGAGMWKAKDDKCSDYYYKGLMLADLPKFIK